MSADPAVLEVLARYGAAAAAVRARVLSYVQRVWGYLPSYDRVDIDRFVELAVPAVAAGQVQTAALTDAYLAAVESVVTGETVRPLGVPADLVADEAMRGVAASEVYARTGPTVWLALKEGNLIGVAVQAGLRRANSMAATDLQLAKTHASRHVLAQKDHVTGYRRALTGSKSCGLCVVASTQRYRKADLLPCHPGCDCAVVPIIGREDPGQVIDPDRLEGVHQAIADRFGAASESTRARDGIPDYRDVLVTHEHGELGPVLARKGDAFTGPSDI